MLNILMVVVGIVVLAVNIYNARSTREPEMPEKANGNPSGLGIRRFALVILCVVPLVIPSDATRDVPAAYGERHPGLEHSWMYPNIANALAEAEREKEQGK